jgi:hypothetical protein
MLLDVSAANEKCGRWLDEIRWGDTEPVTWTAPLCEALEVTADLIELGAHMALDVNDRNTLAEDVPTEQRRTIEPALMGAALYERALANAREDRS